MDKQTFFDRLEISTEFDSLLNYCSVSHNLDELTSELFAEIDALQLQVKALESERANMIETHRTTIQSYCIPKTCTTCKHDYGCSIQDSIMHLTPDANLMNFGCSKHEPRTR